MSGSDHQPGPSVWPDRAWSWSASRPQTALADLVDDLANESDQLGLLTAIEDDSLGIRRLFSWSYRSFDPDSAYPFRYPSLAWGTEISLEEAAALARWTTGQTRPRLRRRAIEEQ